MYEPLTAPFRTADPVAVQLDAVGGDADWHRALSRAHVAALMETPDAWPPIVVTRQTLVVLDGRHRVAAARGLGHATIAACWFDGDPDDAFVEFLRLNREHGLPLTLDQRRDAARRLLQRDGARSDRWVAELCGLSPKTVGRVRQTLPAGAAATLAEARIGRDGRVRPTRPNATRARIADELDRNPGASFRKIAAIVGASPQTVRSVARANGGTAPRSAIAAVVSTPPPTARHPRPPVSIAGDRAFQGEEATAAFADLFDRTAVDRRHLLQFVQCVPLSRIYQVADEARGRAAAWREFAEVLEGRVHHRG